MSAVTLRELERAPRAVPDLLGALGNLPEVVAATPDEKRNLVDVYIESGALSGKIRSDPEHIVAATVVGADVLASWNFRHMANLRRIRQYNEVNRQWGIPGGHQESEGVENED